MFPPWPPADDPAEIDPSDAEAYRHGFPHETFAFLRRKAPVARIRGSGRPASAPNPHVAVGGGGAHSCLGVNLARREIAILFEGLPARTREIEALRPLRYRALRICNPVLVAPEETPVRPA
jgi:cytochrome P450